MIFVARSACPASLDPDNPDSAGAAELRSAIQHWLDHNEPPPAKSFTAYRRDDVKDALIGMFHGKCAYCESTVTAGFDGDVEHYRPKGGVTEAARAKVDHPGYWWLAMVWENLLLSCIHCNQARRQLIVKHGRRSVDAILEALESNDVRTTGKKNYFPTDANHWVTDYRLGVSGEKPLLIDPTATEPEALFEWVIDGSFSTLVPRGKDQRAEETEAKLGLNRRYLVEARTTALNRLHRLGANVRAGLEDFLDAPSDAAAAIALRAVERDLDAIRELGEPQNPYAAMARAYLIKMEAVVESVI